MTEESVDFLIVGGGVAGYSCARTLCDSGAGGSIALVTRDPDPPYDRTACTKGYLRGSTSHDEALLAPHEWWEQHEVALNTRTSVLKLDAAGKTVTLSDKRTVRFGQALLSTGANVRRLRVEGADLHGIHYVRSLGNADAIRADAEDAEDVVLVGGSYIATEVAASLTALGKRCTILMQEGVTLERSFGPRAGSFFQGVLEEHGVAVYASDELERFEGSDGRVTHVVTVRGRRLPAQVVVIGAGVVPDAMLAHRAGLDIGATGGVVADACLRSSAPGIFVAGDMCEYESVLHRGARLRIEHWDVAEKQGATAAGAMLGDPRPHDIVPYFFSDLADWASLEYVGPAVPGMRRSCGARSTRGRSRCCTWTPGASSPA
jgi:3-phenylpropionate/trans-cinnamate dioxygenase ferredoxin reductase subunit